jgi:hypothetical protein
MACPAVSIPNVDAARWAQLKAAALSKAGVDITQDHGAYEGHGFRVTWDYDGSELAIKVTDHPFFISCDFVNGMISHGISSL